MAIPDFPRQTIEMLARRARFQCSNPDCAAQTIGPNSDPDKATLIGEAAHIRGAKPGSSRYDPAISDVTRAEITNGIWLCRNCHGQVDRDAMRYPAELLFAWRKEHEDRVLRELGSRGERIRRTVEMGNLEFLLGYPQIIQRIVMDKPEGWEWRFVAELMRHLNKPELKRLQNLRAGHYFRPTLRVGTNEFISWLNERTHVTSNLIRPFTHLFERLTLSFGAPGKPGNIEEMHDVCILIHGMLAQMVDHEEILEFTQLPSEAEELRTILQDIVGQNVAGLAALPEKLDEMVAMIGTDHGGTKENPRIITWRVPFSVPADVNQQFEAALDRYVSGLTE